MGLSAVLAASGCAPARPSVPSERPRPEASLPTQRPYTVGGRVYFPLPSAEGYREVGYASWYGSDFHGKRTANGERYDMHGLTAAHRILPMNTVVRVTSLGTGREAVVRINDRGPFVKERIIDLSYGAAKKLGLLKPGTALVRVEALGEAPPGGGSPAGFLHRADLRRGPFYIQVGAFLQKQKAEALRRKLAREYPEVAVSRQRRTGRTFYLVRIFTPEGYEAARAVEARLERAGFPEAFLVAR